MLFESLRRGERDIRFAAAGIDGVDFVAEAVWRRRHFRGRGSEDAERVFGYRDGAKSLGWPDGAVFGEGFLELLLTDGEVFGGQAEIWPWMPLGTALRLERPLPDRVMGAALLRAAARLADSLAAEMDGLAWDLTRGPAPFEGDKLDWRMDEAEAASGWR